MEKWKVLGVVLILIFFTGCTSYGYFKDAEEAENKSDYFNAAYYLIKAIYWNNNNRNAQDKLIIIYPRALEAEYNEIVRLEKEVPFDLQKIVFHYRRLLRLQKLVLNIENIEHYATGELLVFKKAKYASQLRKISLIIAEDHYKKGVALSAEDVSKKLKLAKEQFGLALEVAPGYKDSMEQIAAIEERLSKLELDAELVKAIAETPDKGDSNISIRFHLNFNEQVKVPADQQLAEMFVFEDLKQKGVDVGSLTEKSGFVDYELVLTITGVEYLPGKTKTSGVYNSGLDAEKEGSQVKAHSKSMPVKMHYSLKLFDAMSGDVRLRHTGIFKHTVMHEWLTYSGEKIETDESENSGPGKPELLKETLKALEKEISGIIEVVFN